MPSESDRDEYVGTFRGCPIKWGRIMFRTCVKCGKEFYPLGPTDTCPVCLAERLKNELRRKHLARERANMAQKKRIMELRDLRDMFRSPRVDEGECSFCGLCYSRIMTWDDAEGYGYDGACEDCLRLLLERLESELSDGGE